MKVKKPIETCRLTQKEKTCAYLAVGHKGFECLYDDPLINSRVLAGTMVARGKGDWPECQRNQK